MTLSTFGLSLLAPLAPLAAALPLFSPVPTGSPPAPPPLPPLPFAHLAEPSGSPDSVLTGSRWSPASPTRARSRPEQDAQPTLGVWPLLPVPDVAEGFDPPDSDYGSGHRGVDLTAGVGQPVRAALAGRVSFASRLAGRGVVVVDHGATRTTYEPVAASVAVGDRVGPGDRIGRVQLPGSHCLPRGCLHWGWIDRSAGYLNPLDLVGAGPVVLLPFRLGGAPG